MIGKIHSIVIYPYIDPRDRKDLICLYEHLGFLTKDSSKYKKPVTVLNRQTQDKSEQESRHGERKIPDNCEIPYHCQKCELALGSKELRYGHINNFISSYLEEKTHIVNAWCVDTCQMWLTGFGYAFDLKGGDEGDVFWFIPGDFRYCEDQGDIFTQMISIPDNIIEPAGRLFKYDVCIGEIKVDREDSKQLIDTYGTYGLLANWFPHEAKQIRRITTKPRTEFLAVSRGFLRHALSNRWYPYEQTLVMLLQCLRTEHGERKINKIELGTISDLPQGRDALSGAMQQLERTERVLKLFWREQQFEPVTQWIDTFRRLDTQSEQIRGAALVILANLLRENEIV